MSTPKERIFSQRAMAGKTSVGPFDIRKVEREWYACFRRNVHLRTGNNKDDFDGKPCSSFFRCDHEPSEKTTLTMHCDVGYCDVLYCDCSFAARLTMKAKERSLLIIFINAF